MNFIVVDDYFAGHPALRTPEFEANAAGLLVKVNPLRAQAEADGVIFTINHYTGSYISGTGNGGIRPGDSKVGLPLSNHKTGHGVDNHDGPKRMFQSWCMAHRDRLSFYGLYMEDPRWCVTLNENKEIVGSWVHLQDVPPHSGRVVYIPSTDPPLAEFPPVWGGP